METKMLGGYEATEAKRSRHNSGLEKNVEEEDYELELHQSGPIEFELDDDAMNENRWEEDDDEDDIKVEIGKGMKTLESLRPPVAPVRGKGRALSKGNENFSDSDSVSTQDDQRMRLKRPRPFESTECNFEVEPDPVVIARRTKQIEYGKNTPEYFNYTQAVPRESRKPCHPRTPNKYRKYSRRAWDGIVKQWRINLHCWSDYPISASDQLAATESDLEKLNESFASEASGSTSTTSSVAAAFGADLGFFSSASAKIPNVISRSRSTSGSENESNVGSIPACYESSTREIKVPKKRKDQIKQQEAVLEKVLLSTSWADDVEDYYNDESLPSVP